MNIAICCIAYNRLDCLKRLLDSLAVADYSNPVPLIVSIDKSDSDEVEKYADSYQWLHGDKKVIKHNENLGLRKHILSCGDLLNDYDALIVLEDDITVAQSFYTYAVQCVIKYSDDMDCAGISLYNFPLNYQNSISFTPIRSDSDVYLMNCAQSWGQVWMKKQWLKFREWYDSHNEEFGLMPHLPKTICCWPRSSWLKYHTRYCIENNKYFVYPYVSLSTNNGDAGTHALKRETAYQAVLQYGKKELFNLNPSVRYDGFFENVAIANALGLQSDDLCVDLYGEKGNREKCRFWLSLSHHNYKILNSYALDLKPWDMNILQNRKGYDIFLYDTEVKIDNKFRTKANKISVLEDYYHPMANGIVRIIINSRLVRKILLKFRLLL